MVSQEEVKIPYQWIIVAIVLSSIPTILSLFEINSGFNIEFLDTIGREDALFYVLEGATRHIFLEVSVICVAFFIAILALINFRVTKNIVTSIIGSALLFSSCVDVFNLLGTDHLFETMMNDQDLISFTWTISQIFNSMILFVGVVILLVTEKECKSIKLIVNVNIFAGIITCVTIYVVASSKNLPAMIYPDVLFVRPFDAIPLVLFVFLGAVLYPRLIKKFPSVFSKALIVSVIPEIAVQIHMVFGIEVIFDNHLNTEHFFKIASYLVLSVGLVMDYAQIHQSLKQNESRLLSAKKAAEQTAENLAETARNLAREVKVRKTLQVMEQKRSEELRRAKKKADAANRAKSIFLANMSHEIRTPMNAVIGLTSLVLNGNLEQKQRDCLLTVQTAGKSLLTILNEILDLAKVESGRITLKKESFDLVALLKEVCQIFSTMAEEKGIGLTFEIAFDSPVFFGDRQRLRQVLFNLINNAIKFTEKGGITIEVSLDCDDFLLFAVTDTGIGIPKDKQRYILKPFYQVDEGNTRKYKGTGLGTAIAKRFIELMDGRLWFKSEEGKGTIFYFTVRLPIGTTEVISIRKEANIKLLKLPPLKILVVDDVQSNIDVVCGFLEQFGDHEVYEASSGKRAVELCQTIYFDVILMDIRMSEMSGIDTTELIRDNERKAGKKRTSVIGVSASTRSIDREVCNSVGMEGFVEKPIDPQVLLRAIAQVMHIELEEVEEQVVEESIYTVKDLDKDCISVVIDRIQPKLKKRRMGAVKTDLIALEQALQGFAKQEMSLLVRCVKDFEAEMALKTLSAVSQKCSIQK